MLTDNRIKITRFVSAYRKHLVAGRILQGSAIALATFFILIAILEAVFAVFPWIILPVILDGAACGLGLFLLGSIVVETAIRAPSLLAAAGMIERRADERNPLLALALELSDNKLTRDNPFTDLACSRAAAVLDRCPAAPPPPHLALPALIVALVCAVWCFTNHILNPRILNYWNLPFSNVSRLAMTISPGSKTVPMNATVELRCTCNAARFPLCRLSLTASDDEPISTMFLRPDVNGDFVYRLDSVKNTFIYRFDLRGESRLRDTVTVAPPPRLLRVNVAIRPPSYTRLASRVLPGGQGDFDAYPGSQARITIESERLAGAWLIRDRDTAGLNLDGTLASREVEVTAPCSYTFALRDSLGQRSDSLPWFHIGCIADEPPSVQIIKPGANRDLRPEQQETLAVEGTDDLGIRTLLLKWRLGGGRGGDTGRHDLSNGSQAAVIRSVFFWNLTELALFPGDTVFYWAEVTDTRPYGKPQRGSSDTFWFRIPSLEEIHRKLAEKEDYAEKSLSAARARQGALADRLQEVMKSMAGKKDLSWEQREILRDVKQGFQAQADSLKQSISALKENVEKMKRQGTIGEELSRKFDEVRKAVDELIKAYGDSLLFNMNDMDKPVSPKEIRQAIDKVQASLPKLDEQLEDALKYLKMLKEDRKLAEMAMRAEQLSAEQSSLSHNDSTGASAAARQKDLLDRIKDLSKDVADHAKTDLAGKGGLDSLSSKRGLDSLRKTMESAMAERPLPSRESMNRMSGSLLSLSQDLMQMMNFSQGRRLERERGRLLSLTHEALSLADWQEELSRAPEGSRDPASAARSQQALRDALKRSREAADSLAMVPPDQMLDIANAFKGAEQSAEAVLNGEKGMSGRESMAGSSAALRSLANTFLSAMSRMDNGQEPSGMGGAGMMPGLRRLSGRQAAINSATADLLSSLLKGSGSSREGGSGGSQAAEGARRAAQNAQQAIADELKQLAEKYGNEAGPGLRDKAGDLEKEARQLAQMLERPSPGVVEHQDRFLARMLETTLSMHRQGEGKDEWKSRSADNPFQTGIVPPPADFFRDKDSFHRLRQRAFQGNFPEAYREALLKYFDALGEHYLK